LHFFGFSLYMKVEIYCTALSYTRITDTQQQITTPAPHHSVPDNHASTPPLSTRKRKPIWILLKHKTVSGSGISWAMCKSASHSKQITTPAPHHSVFTGWTPFLTPNQQRQSTEGSNDIHQQHPEKTQTWTVISNITETGWVQNAYLERHWERPSFSPVLSVHQIASRELVRCCGSQSNDLGIHTAHQQLSTTVNNNNNNNNK